ncbi:major facilitator superfamily transporter [Haladaptatus paucihalophilus DX253]|uniref:Major facilitator superfamily transporter n=2 Tax=Haladaptatus TaxID=367188 RepID=E7QX45_HALPU|nr:major facilitator superfamily transporter [Haladaptatus paucihalophilus DX253]GKZ15640.1 MFS transporter [Haladaptatus sp. T7]SHK23829.1 Predicted arabinose efflux permease, MFS family [Haladaptatus paucihalophilus DX253]
MVFLVNFARVMFAPLLEPLKHEFLVSNATVGLIATLVWLGSALPRIPTGYLLTRVERHRAVLGAGIVLTAAAGFTAFAPSVPLLAVGAFTMGVSSAVYFIAANPLVSELYPDRVGRAIGIHGTASQLAAAIAPVFVGVMLTVVGWRGVLKLLAAVAAAVTVVFFVVARRTDLPDAGATDREFVTAFRRQWPIILSGVAIIGATGFVWNGLFNFYPSYLHQTKGLSPETARTLLTVVFAAGVPAFWFTGRLADRLPHVPLMLSILGGFIVCLLGLTAAQGLAAIVAVSLALGYVIHSLFPALDTYLLDSLPDENRASAYAMYSGLAMIGQAGGSSVVGALLDAGYLFDTVFRTFAVGLLAILAVLFVLHRANRLPATAVTS